MKAAIGVELGPHGARVVAIGDDAKHVVLARADRPAPGGALTASAREAVEQVYMTLGGDRMPAGICAFRPQDDAVRAAVAALRAVVSVAGEVNAAGLTAAIAEAWIGAAKDARHVVSLVIADEISAGILIDRRPWHGAHGRAGSAAWLALNPVERQDYRRSGCLDAEVSARGVARRLVWRIESGDRSAVLERAGMLDAITADHVYEAARAGDGVAMSVVRDTAKYIGMAIANLITTLDPDVVVLGGMVARVGDILLEPVRQECARRLPPSLAESCRIEMSSLGEDAAAIGAARLALT